MKIVRPLVLGLRRHLLRAIGSTLLAYSAIWTLVESLAFFHEQLDLSGGVYYGILVVLSVGIGCGRVYQPTKVTVRIASTDTKLTIYYGDIFKQPGFLAIPVNEYFDSELGLPVAASSLHGIVISEFFGGHSDAFERLVDEELDQVEFVETPRDQGRTRRYPIGSCALVTAMSHRMLLFALCRTDLDTLKAYAGVPELWIALKGLFKKARMVAGGESLVLPLVGGGISGMGIPPTQLLQLIVLAIVEETKRREICKSVDIVLHDSKFDEIDLEAIKTQWE